ncbi:MAG: hypothetical protein VX792_04385 [Candidatus Latescibacterota bacterium]|nr:hypothetical protein [Candidatus Latescibacterota bacterium]
MFLKRVGVILGLYALCALHNPTYTIAGGHRTGGDSHGGDHMGPPTPPPAVAEEIEEILAEGGLSETAEAMLEFLLLAPAEREYSDELDFTEEDGLDAKEEIEEIFKGLLEDDISEEVNDYLNMMIHNMDGEDHMPPPHDGEHHAPPPHDGEHMGPPTPPPAVAEIIEDVLAEGELSETAEAMLEFLLLTPAEREYSDEPDFTEEDELNAKEEIEEIFKGLLEDDISEEVNDYLNMMIHNMDGEDHMPPPHDGEHHEGE